MFRLPTSTLFSVFMPLSGILCLTITLLALYVHPAAAFDGILGDLLALLIGVAIILWAIPILVAIKRLPPPPAPRPR
jgi:hypothetical protein